MSNAIGRKSTSIRGRTEYRNGDSVALKCGCDGCSPSVVNGILCHESGCPDAWRDHARDCSVCGFEFFRSERYEHICPDCVRDADFADLDLSDLADE